MLETKREDGLPVQALPQDPGGGRGRDAEVRPVQGGLLLLEGVPDGRLGRRRPQGALQDRRRRPLIQGIIRRSSVFLRHNLDFNSIYGHNY